MSDLILFEDDHLLVVNKPAGINTHKPDGYAPDGLHEWLTKREPRWARLAIHQRLDKETSGVMVFGKTTAANQSLSRQFETRQVHKRYLLISDRRPSRVNFRAKNMRTKTADEETEFELLGPLGRYFLVEARPRTGKTHQIRRHAADNQFPILGDTKYGGTPAPRLMLHARSLGFAHPLTGERLTFTASIPVAFDYPDEPVPEPDRLFDDNTNAFRLLNTADVVVDSYAGNVLVQWQTEQESSGFYERLREICQPATIYAQTATKQKRTKPVAVLGGPVPDRFPIRENGVTYLINFGEGLSTGIFLDQRENRRRLLRMPLAGKSVLNCFAYTCAFSVAAAKAGAVTTSVDLSRNHLEWGQANFRANELNSVFHADDRPVEKRNLPIGVGHEFLVGDVFEWLKRFAKRGRTWDVVLLDPPTFSTTKKGRGFQAERDYRELAALAVPLVARGGTLFGSTNQRTFAPAAFEQTLRAAVRQCGRDLTAVEFETLPFDFRLGEGERAYLKTFWLQLR